MTRHVYVLVAGVVTAILAAAPATAQSRFRPYAGASIGSFSVSADQVDGRSLAGGLFGGVSLAKHVDLDVEFVFPADTFTRSYTGPGVSFAGPEASYDEILRRAVITRYDRSREVTATLSAVVVFRPPLGKSPHAWPDRRRDQPSCARSECLYAGVNPGGHRSPASISRRQHRNAFAEYWRSDVRGEPRDRRDAAVVDYPGCALRLRIDRRRDQQLVPNVSADAVAILVQKLSQKPSRASHRGVRRARRERPYRSRPRRTPR